MVLSQCPRPVRICRGKKLRIKLLKYNLQQRKRKKGGKNVLCFIQHKFICSLTKANKKGGQHTKMHIKDLGRVFYAQTP